MLERALTAIATQEEPENGKESNPKDMSKSTKTVVEKKYLPLSENYVNPAPRPHSSDGTKKWPEKGRWVCGYCRQIFPNVRYYKDHLKKTHRNGKYFFNVEFYI